MQMMMNTMLGVLWSGDTRYTPDTAAGQWRVITNSNLSLGLQLSTTPGTARAHSNLSNKLCVLAAGRSWQAPTSLWLHANWRGAAAACWLQSLHWPWSPHNLLRRSTLCLLLLQILLHCQECQAEV